MPEFTLITPGTARHRDGWSVGHRGRWHITYDDGGRRAEMEIEHGLTSDTIYPDTLCWTAPDSRDATKEERPLITERVAAALVFMTRKRIDTHAGNA